VLWRYGFDSSGGGRGTFITPAGELILAPKLMSLVGTCRWSRYLVDCPFDLLLCVTRRRCPISLPCWCPDWFIASSGGGTRMFLLTYT
jgi:hypothetical protein